MKHALGHVQHLGMKAATAGILEWDIHLINQDDRAFSIDPVQEQCQILQGERLSSAMDARSPVTGSRPIQTR